MLENTIMKRTRNVFMTVLMLMASTGISAQTVAHFDMTLKDGKITEAVSSLL